jgi:hypothetical protein
MRNGIYGECRKKFLFLGILLLLIGCASDPVPTYLPINHPANPDADEVVFTAAPNPFVDNQSINQLNPMKDQTMSHGGHENRHSHKMEPDRNNLDKTVETKTEKSDHRQ